MVQSDQGTNQASAANLETSNKKLILALPP